MAIVAEIFDFVIGIDTNSRTHTYAIIDTTTGARIGCEAFPVTKSGMNPAIAWIHRNTTGEILAAIEGINSYGSSIRRALIVEGVRVVEVKPPKKKARHGVGKSDPIDGFAAAASILGQETDLLLQPRRDGERDAISVLLAARRRIDHQRTANRNALNALARQIDLGVDARHALTDKQVKEISEWRAREHDTVEERVARVEAIEQAKSLKAYKTRLKEIEAELVDLEEKLTPGMQDQFVMDPVTVGIILAAYSHPGRIRSEAAFAALAGASPLQASSGYTKRHRVNRGGDRQLNMALDIIAKTRMRGDEKTKAYVERRTAEALSYREPRDASNASLPDQYLGNWKHLA